MLHFSVLDNIIRRGFVWPNRFNFYLPIEAVQNLRDQTFAMPPPQAVGDKITTFDLGRGGGGEGTNM